MIALLALVVLTPTLDGPAELHADVVADWSLNGQPIGTSWPGQPLQINATGHVELLATSQASEPWAAMVRTLPDPGGHIVPADAWIGYAKGQNEAKNPDLWPLLASCLALATAISVKNR